MRLTDGTPPFGRAACCPSMMHTANSTLYVRTYVHVHVHARGGALSEVISHFFFRLQRRSHMRIRTCREPRAVGPGALVTPRDRTCAHRFSAFMLSEMADPTTTTAHTDTQSHSRVALDRLHLRKYMYVTAPSKSLPLPVGPCRAAPRGY